MAYTEHTLRAAYHKNIRRVKRWLKPLPRRAMIHKYPFIKWFAKFARSRPYLWSFKSQHVVPALYAGSILTLVPLYGMQIPIAFALSLLLRCNLTIFVALQFISNPLTVPPIYFADYQVGKFIIEYLFFWEPSSLMDSLAGQGIEEPLIRTQTGVKQGFKLFAYTMLGGAILGYILGLILAIAYKKTGRHLHMKHIKIKEALANIKRKKMQKAQYSTIRSKEPRN